MRNIAAVPALGLLAGSSLGLLAPDLSPVVGWTLMSLSALVALWAWCAARPALLATAVGVAFFGGGGSMAAVAWEDAWRPPLRVQFERAARAERRAAEKEGRAPPLDDEAFAIVEGVLRADAAPSESGVSLSVDVDGLEGQERQERQERPEGQEAADERFPSRPSGLSRPSLGGVIVTVVGALTADHQSDWRAGRRVRFPVQLHRPARYLNPGVPDSERALARRGTTLVGTVESGALVEVVARAGPAAEGLAAARAYAREAIAAAVGRWSSRSAAIVAAIVIGDRAGLDDDVQRRLQEAGTYHVIAISGGNIAILVGLLIGAFRLAGALGRTAMLAAIPLLVAYAMLVGGGASVDRATMMAVVYLAARALDHRSPALNSLALVVAFLVATDPLTVADPAFLLTCGATLAILVVVPEVQGRVWPRGARAFVVMLTASAATEALLFPVGAFVFSRVTFAGLALNFLAIPLMAAAQIAGMAVVPLFALSTRLAAACGWVAHIGAAGLVWSANLVRFAPLATWRVAAPGVGIASVYYAALAAAWAFRPRAGAAVAIALAAAVWILAEPWALLSARGDGRLHVTFIDVGQGDAAFVTFPRGHTMVVDTGGLGGTSSFDIGDRVVAPVLRLAGVRRLDALALTHGDGDHIGGAPSVLAEFRPREVLEGIPVPPFKPLIDLQAEADAIGAKWTNVRRNDRFVIDGVDVRVLHPAEPDWERQKVRNDDSIVMELSWRDVSVLLTGDIGREVEGQLPPLSLSRLRVLKIPHHGSLTSSGDEFVRAVHPDLAVASVGRSNTFGHPAKLVLQRYESAGAEVLRTDRDGAVTVDTDGHSLDVRTFTGRELSIRTAHHEDTKESEDTK